MLWASFTLAFDGFLRCSEFTCNDPFDCNVHLTRADVTFVPDIDKPQRMEVRIKKSKTDPFRQTALTIIAKTHTHICAVSAVRDFILQTPNPNPDSLLFQFRDGSYLSRRSLASNLHALIDMCGLHSKDYNTHSFRIGAATTAAAAGVPSWLIKFLGRWRSDSYERYIHLPRATILQVPASMAAYQQNDTPTNLETFDPWK